MRQRCRGLSRHDDADSIILDGIGYGYRKRNFTKLKNFIRIPNAFDDRFFEIRRAIENTVYIVDRRKFHSQLDEETIELRFRQRVCRFKFERIQSSEDNKRLIELVRLLADGDSLFL